MLRIATAVSAAATLALVSSVVAPSMAQEAYPDRPVSMIVPFAAGGPTDALARIIAQGLTDKLGQQVLVENLPGAGGTIGSGRAARAEPDGYTLLVGHAGTLAANVSLYKKLPFDTLKAFEPVAQTHVVPLVLAIVLGDKAEESFRQSLLISQGSLGVFWSNGLVGSIMALGLVALFWPAI